VHFDRSDPAAVTHCGAGTARLRRHHNRVGRPAATTFRFTGLAADDQTVVYGPVTLPAQTNTLLSDVPVALEILQIGYFAGDVDR
jgi:hypothetical protein